MIIALCITATVWLLVSLALATFIALVSGFGRDRALKWFVIATWPLCAIAHLLFVVTIIVGDWLEPKPTPKTERKDHG